MAQLPVTGYLENATRDEGEMKPAFEAIRDVISQQIGGAPRTGVTISGGAILPATRDTGGTFVLETEGAAATDDLNTITTTNTPDGTVIRLFSANESRVTTVKHGIGGTGQILTQDGNDFELTYLETFIDLQLDGVSWKEVGRYRSPKTPETTVYTASTTWNKPTGLVYIEVEMVGGGGGGGGSQAATHAGGAGAAGSGGYSKKTILAADLGATESVTVGAGGAAGSSGFNSGASGGTSSFGSHCSASGGLGSSGKSSASTGSNGAVAGIGTGGDVNSTGNDGDSSLGALGTGANVAYIGGSKGSHFGGGRRAFATSGSGAGTPGNVYGGGGTGGYSALSGTNQPGGAGADGVVIVKEFYS